MTHSTHQTSQEEPGFLPVHVRITRLAAATPDAPAVRCEGQTLSYAELDRRAGQLARRLVALGAGHDRLVAVGMSRSIDMIVALLAVLKSGAAYLPIDLAYPKSRTQFVLQDARPLAFLGHSANQAELPALGDVPLLLIDDPTSPVGSEPAIEPASPDDLAYVIYTSGSTGTPKGCLVTQRNMARLFDATQPWFDFGPGDVWTFFHSHAFDFSAWEIWGALSYGGCVVVVPQSVTRAPGAFLQLLADEKVTVLNQTPSAFRALIEADRRDQVAPDVLALRLVIFGGEALELQMLKPWIERHGDSRPRLVNMYGITETTVHVTYRPISAQDVAAGRGSVIGEPIPDLAIHLVDGALTPVPAGQPGEILVSGAGVSKGYLGRDELTAERFVEWSEPASGRQLRAYRSGDLARRLPDGELEYLGRIDRQVKIRGFRIETGEIESALMGHDAVRACAVVARQDDPVHEPRLVAYVVTDQTPLPTLALRRHLASTLPDYMVPATMVAIDALPLTENGKLDVARLPPPPRQRPELAQPYAEPRGALERQVCAAFAAALELEAVGRNDNFFDLGGDSLRVQQVLAQLQSGRAHQLSANLFFDQPTPAALATALGIADAGDGNPATATASPHLLNRPNAQAEEPIALIAMAGRFPGAADVEQLWDNLCAGRDSISFFDDTTLDASVDAAHRADPAYIRARGVIDQVDQFDAAFFGINPKEAQLMDPQQRLFLEICWECIERAGYAPDGCPGRVGVFAGMNNATYFQRHVQHHPELIEAVGAFQVMLDNEKDFIATRVAHRLNLTGPAISVNTACSTSLVAVAQAFTALRTGQCEMALAGGIAVTCPPRSGYLYQEGSMLSPDGHTRSFDAHAQGTVFCDGAGVVMLKRLSDALADGDPIYAVLRGAALNNDGGAKASFTAPSIDGQARVVAAALADAGVPARSISYVETHGTATPMGDPVEIAALTRVFAADCDERGFCRIGSVKSNIGHLVTAAGVTGLIKTALALHHERIPASIHYDAPNPAIDFPATPFVVNDRMQPWPRAPQPRRAGVSSFGVGGTNAHVIVEEAPARLAPDAGSGPQLLQLSARTPAALQATAARLADYLEAHPQASLADVAHTLRSGRKPFVQRACVVAEEPAAAIEALRRADSRWKASAALPQRVPAAVFMFPGQGAQYAGMGRALRMHDAVFGAAFDAAIRAFDGLLPFDLGARLASDDAGALALTSATQPATFALEYALARRVQALGVQPAALVGHSVGEFAAAVIAGVMSLADAARLVAQRGALMNAQPAGSMLSVRMSADKLQALLTGDLSLAAENGPTASVAAGPTDQVDALLHKLEEQGVAARKLQTSHAFHSAMMEPALAPFAALVRTVELHPPALALYSTLTGCLLQPEEAIDPNYWARHMRETVRFSRALRAIQADLPQSVFIELGPRETLCSLVRQHAGSGGVTPAVATMGAAPADEPASLQFAAGRLWCLGLESDSATFDLRQNKRRLCLPTYPFERKRFWVDAPVNAAAGSLPAPTPVSIAATTDVIEQETTMTAPAGPSAPARRADLVVRLRELFEDISGLDMGQAPSAAPFVEIGLDSLTLTQAALQVKKAFQVSLSFRQLMESYRSFDALAEYLDATLPPEPVHAPVTPAPTAPVAASISTMAASGATLAPALMMPTSSLQIDNGSLLQQVISQQMQLMQQQLALLSTAPPGANTVQRPAVPSTQPEPAATVPCSPPDAATAPADPDEAAGPVHYDVKKAFGAIARIHTQTREPDALQKARLAAFVRRYVEKTGASKAFTERNRPHMADPRVVNGFRPITKEIVYQIVVERSKGSRLWDIDGNEYVDVLSGFGMNLFGWQPDFVQEAVRRQLELGYEIGPQHPLAAEVTQQVCELTGFERAALCNTGSEAVMAAIRIARTVSGRNTVVVFTGSYHGTFDEVLVRAGRGAKGLPAAPGIMPGMFGDIKVLDYGTPEALDFIRAHGIELAAVLVEPVQSRRPELQPRAFLRELRVITEQAGTCLIFDEVITGFRSHLGGAQAVFGVRADLATYGKVIGGGFPVGVVAGRREYMDALDGGAWNYGDDSMPTVGVTYFAGTFVRHPLALAACKASLAHLKQSGEALQTTLNLHTAAMADELSAFCREAGAPLEIRYFSSLWRVSWLEDHPLQDLLFAMMRNRGVHILDNFPCFLTTAHSQADIATIKTAFKESVREMQDAGFLPRRAAAESTFDPSHPPVPDARLGRDRDGQPAWFVPDPDAQGKFKRIQA